MLVDVEATDVCIVEKGYSVLHHPDDRRGFSEKHIRKQLEKRGWTVWRGGFLHATRKPRVYPNVQRKYERLELLLGDVLPLLQYMGVVHHGMPDFLCWKGGTFKFVECKLGYECLSERQRLTCSFLHKQGFCVEVHRVVEHQTKRRLRNINLATGEASTVVVQTQLSDFSA